MRRDRAGAGRLVAGMALTVAGALSGCSGSAGGAPAVERPAAEPVVETYVALGDSFTAAPFVPGTSLAGGCLRSSANYPSLVAEQLGAKLRDVSCSGAATADIRARQPRTHEGVDASARPQLAAVRRGTDLVTVGIGGNDENLFQTLVQQCTSAAGASGAPCADLLSSSSNDLDAVLGEVGGRVVEVLDAVRAKAPDAEVVLVGYPRLVNQDGSCAAMPIAERDLPLVAGLEERLNQTLARAARAGGAQYVDMYAVSEGHEICSDDPWVNGRVTDQQRALAYHPFAEGQQAVADEVLDLLSP